jgi:hypothetical protein
MSFSSIYESLDNIEDQELWPGINPSEMTRWDQLLYYFSQGRSVGLRAYDYIPFTAIAPRFLPSTLQTPAWILEKVRGDISSDLLKLRPGSAICLQDISRQEAFYDPIAPTMMGTIDRMLWCEIGYQVASICTHVYSPRGYDFEYEYFCLAAIPIHYVDSAFWLPLVSCGTLGQSSLGNDVWPPLREWNTGRSGLRELELGEILVADRSQAISEWVDEQSQLGWF